MLHHLFVHVFDTAMQKAAQYHVDPKTFAILYVIHYLLLWPTCAWILVAYRKGKEISSLVSLAVFFLIMPWFYPLFFGRMPWYFDAALVVAMIVIAWHGYHKILKRIANEREIMAVAADIKAEERV
jgi:hypothetical protein